MIMVFIQALWALTSDNHASLSIAKQFFVVSSMQWLLTNILNQAQFIIKPLNLQLLANIYKHLALKSYLLANIKALSQYFNNHAECFTHSSFILV